MREVAMKAPIRPEKIIKKYFLRKKKSQRGFSLRKLAHQLSIQPSYLSGVLSGKKSFPQGRYLQFIKHLEMDDFAALQLKESLLYHQNSVEKLPMLNVLDKSKGKLSDLADVFEPISTNQYQILERWYYLPLLDLCTCTNFKSDLNWISKKLRVSKDEASEGLKFLLERGFLKEDNGIYMKTSLNIRFPNKGAHTSILGFHKMMLKKAHEDLSRINNFNFDLRFYNGITLAVDSNKIQEVKTILKEAIHRAALTATAGNSTEVYFLNVSYFPLSDNSD